MRLQNCSKVSRSASSHSSGTWMGCTRVVVILLGLLGSDWPAGEAGPTGLEVLFSPAPEAAAVRLGRDPDGFMSVSSIR